MGHDSSVRVIRSLGCAVMALVAAMTIGLASSVAASAPASATTAAAMTDTYTAPPSPLSVFVTPFKFGMQVSMPSRRPRERRRDDRDACADHHPAPHTGT